MTPILAFDIETVPDIAGLRLLRGLDAKLSDRDVAEHAFQQRRAQTGQDFLPVLHYRGLVHGVSAPRYWDTGEDDRDFKFNNYISRYHQRHLDLMELLALYQARNYVQLDELARLLGFPGKIGMDGSKVWEAYQSGRIDDIRSYCETDVANTYLVFLRFQLLRGACDEALYRRELELVRDTLGHSKDAHWREFIGRWS